MLAMTYENFTSIEFLVENRLCYMDNILQTHCSNHQTKQFFIILFYTVLYSEK